MGMLPIRKIKPEKVALTSYYGKVFVERNQKVVHNYSKWLRKQVDKMVMDNEDTRLTKVKTMTVSFSDHHLPRVLSIMALNYQSFTAGGIDFYFNYSQRKEHFGDAFVENAEVDDAVVVGKKGRLPVVIDNDNTFYLVRENDVEVLGKIEDLLGLDRLKAPVDIADLKVFSKTIPVGLVLGYHFGIKRLLQSLDGETRTVKAGEALKLDRDEVAIRFKDESLIYSRDNKLMSLILSGFNEYKNSIKRFSIHDFNDRDVFLNLLTDHGLSTRHLNEMELLNDYFIDPITEELLKEMKEPTHWFGLLKRSCELLLTDYSPNETDLSYMRIRGYERIAGGVYQEMINSMRDYRTKGNSPNASVQMNPFAVWTRVTTTGDASVTIEEDTNPIQNLKQKEAVTFMGEGGRGRVSMVARTRLYTENDKGVISEATVDSGDVAINVSTSANPNFTSLRGLTRPYDKETDSATNIVSTSALLTPGADRDDQLKVG